LAISTGIFIGWIAHGDTFVVDTALAIRTILVASAANEAQAAPISDFAVSVIGAIRIITTQKVNALVGLITAELSFTTGQRVIGSAAILAAAIVHITEPACIRTAIGVFNTDYATWVRTTVGGPLK